MVWNSDNAITDIFSLDVVESTHLGNFRYGFIFYRDAMFFKLHSKNYEKLPNFKLRFYLLFFRYNVFDKRGLQLFFHSQYCIMFLKKDLRLLKKSCRVFRLELPLKCINNLVQFAHDMMGSFSANLKNEGNNLFLFHVIFA